MVRQLDLTAIAVCKELKIPYQKVINQLTEAKLEGTAYKEVFYNGSMAIGDFKGESV